MTSTIDTTTFPVGSRIVTVNGNIGTLLGYDDNGLPYVVVRRPGATDWRLVRLAAHAEMTLDLDPAEPGPTLNEIGRLYIAKQQAIEEAQARRLTEADALRTEFEAFKEKVRTVALRKKADENWCDSGFNEAMRELGLPGVTLRWRVPVQVTAVQTVYMVVEADDEADAVRQAADEADSDDLWSQAGAYDWEYSDYDIGSRYEVEEDDE
jgi:hypothetical protein